MNIQQLITFVNYAKEKSYTKVALKLDFAVSTVADHIYSLEREFGVKLVSRKGKKGSLTESGEIFLPFAHSILREYEEALNAVELSKGVQGSIRIAAVESIALFNLHNILYKFSQKYPNTNISVTIQDPINFQQLLLKEDIDIAIKYDIPESISDIFDTNLLFDTKLLFDTPAVLFANKEHPLANKKTISIENLKLQNFILTQEGSKYTKLLKSTLGEIDYNILMYMDSDVLIKKTVQREDVLSLLPEIAIKDELKNNELIKLNLENLDFKLTAYAITLKKDWQRPVIREFLKFLREEFDLLINNED